MKFLVDECTGPGVVIWLRKQNHEVFSIYEEARGSSDDEILDKALKEEYILITNDSRVRTSKKNNGLLRLLAATLK